jgi:hypothetical protein
MVELLQSQKHTMGFSKGKRQERGNRKYLNISTAIDISIKETTEITTTTGLSGASIRKMTINLFIKTHST